MTPQDELRQIGSDFPSLAPAALGRSRPPWEQHGEETRYTETGRQALAVIRKVLERRGVNEILVPAYLCESMVEPFRVCGWRIGVLQTSEELDLRDGEMQRDKLREKGRRMAVLLASYFGYSPGGKHVALAEEARTNGAYVIEDETHRPFMPGGVEADVSFSSLRKVLPLADGAYVRGDSDVLAEIDALDQADGDRWIAMDLKRDTANARDYRTAMIEANKQLEDPERLFRASERTLDTLKRLPYDSLAQSRRDNAHVLRAGLIRAGISTLRNWDAPVPSHLVAVVEDPRSVQSHLASEGIFCPIHWPPVSNLGARGHWRSDLLSLPIDHRYGPDDMERIVTVLEEAAG